MIVDATSNPKLAWEITVILLDIKWISKTKLILNHILISRGGYISSSKSVVITCTATENEK